MTREERDRAGAGYIYVIPRSEQLLNENLPRALLAFGCKKKNETQGGRVGGATRGMGMRGGAEEDPSAREELGNKSTMHRPEYQIKRQKPSTANARVIRTAFTGRGPPD